MIEESSCGFKVTFPSSLSFWNRIFSSKDLAEDRVLHLMRCIDLWVSLGDVPFTDDEELDEDWEHFLAGESKMDIWHWFEQEFDISIGGELMFKNLFGTTYD